MLSTADALRHRRFLVTWRDGSAPPGIYPVGALLFVRGYYHYRYLPGAREVPGFRPFLAFPSFDDTYTSAALFPFFASRVMDRRRPERHDFLRALDLPNDASDLDVLARNDGARKGDRVAVTEEPMVELDGRTEHVFVVRGLRFALPDPATRELVLTRLKTASPLEVRLDTENDVNPNALQLTTPRQEPVGWVPDALVSYVSALCAEEGCKVTVRRCNGPEQPAHLRLVARAEGRVPIGFLPFPELTTTAMLFV